MLRGQCDQVGVAAKEEWVARDEQCAHLLLCHSGKNTLEVLFGARIKIGYSSSRSTFQSGHFIAFTREGTASAYRKPNGEDRDPDHPRAVAIVRVRNYSTEHCIAEERERNRDGEEAEIGKIGAPKPEDDQRRK